MPYGHSIWTYLTRNHLANTYRFINFVLNVYNSWSVRLVVAVVEAPWSNLLHRVFLQNAKHVLIPDVQKVESE